MPRFRPTTAGETPQPPPDDQPEDDPEPELPLWGPARTGRFVRWS